MTTNELLTIKNNRIRVLDSVLEGLGRDMRDCKAKGGRYYKKMPGWSFPVEEMPVLMSFLSSSIEPVKKGNNPYNLPDEWYDIFPNFKFLMSTTTREVRTK
jgi:hypothetical protein